jgi:hypothetical protein
MYALGRLPGPVAGEVHQRQDVFPFRLVFQNQSELVRPSLVLPGISPLATEGFRCPPLPADAVIGTGQAAGLQMVPGVMDGTRVTFSAAVAELDFVGMNL